MEERHKPRVAVYVIGQTPRPDLEATLGSLPDVAKVEVLGALDGLPDRKIDSLLASAPPARELAYPLVTTIRSTRRVTIEEVALAPLLQDRINSVESTKRDPGDGPALLHLLMCAGPFATLTSNAPLIRPFGLSVRVLRSLGLQRLAVIVPNHGQRDPARRKWGGAGFDTDIWSLEARGDGQPVDEWVLDMYTGARASALPHPEIIVFDYVGYPARTLAKTRSRIDIPIIDLGVLAVQTATALVERPTDARLSN